MKTTFKTVYAVVHKSYHVSQKDTWKVEQLAYIISTGLKNYTFFNDSPFFSDKEDAKAKLEHCRDLRRHDRKLRKTPGYKDSLWVHEFVVSHHNSKAYLPTVAEIKKGLEYMRANEWQSEVYCTWLNKHGDKTPTQIRNDLIETFVKVY